MEESQKVLVRRSRELEQELEAALAEFGRLLGKSSRTGEEVRLSSKIEKDLTALRSCADEMVGSSVASAAKAQRYREIAYDFELELKRISRELKRERDRAALFSGAQTTDDDNVDPETGGTQPLLEERKHVSGALRGVAAVLGQGLEARAALARQRAALGTSHLTLSTMVQRLPSVEDVITAMQQKKTRHNAVIGTTIGCCASFLIWAVIH